MQMVCSLQTHTAARRLSPAAKIILDKNGLLHRSITTSLAVQPPASYNRGMTSNRHHNFYEDGAVCFWTSSIIAGIPVLRSRTAALSLIEIWDGCRNTCGVKIVGYVIMPDHIHVAIWSEEAESVVRFLRETLSASSAQIAELAQRATERGNSMAARWLAQFKARARGSAIVRVWKERGHGFPVKDADTLRQKLDYMHLNPVRKGHCARAENWEFSSAAWYTDGSGPLRIDEFDW